MFALEAQQVLGEPIDELRLDGVCDDREAVATDVFVLLDAGWDR